MGNGGEKAIPYPGCREVGNQIIVFIHGITIDESLSRGDEGAVGKHPSLGQAGSPGGIVNEGNIIAFTRVYVLLEEAGVRFFIFFAQLQYLVKANEDGVVIITQSLRVPVNDLFQ